MSLSDKFREENVYKTVGGHIYVRGLEEKYDSRKCEKCGKKTAFYVHDASICPF